MICQGCGKDSVPGAEFCSGCGTQLPPAGMAAAPGDQPAGFWIRVAASGIDALLCGLLVYLITDLGLGMSADSARLANLVTLAGILLGIVFLASSHQATPGKLILGLKVVGVDYERLGLGRVIFREVVGKLIASVLLCIGYVMVAFHPEKRGLHDLVARTRVVHAGRRPGTP